MLDRHAWALLRRLTRWLDQFKDCFGHRAQHVSLRQYIDGLLGDSARKSMSAMLARVSEPTSYQAFQHFITHAPWEAEVVWRRLRARDAGAHGHSDPRRDELSQIGAALGRRRAAVLRRAGQGRELPGGRDRRALGRASARGRWARCSICPRRGRAMRRAAPRARIPAAVTLSGEMAAGADAAAADARRGRSR